METVVATSCTWKESESEVTPAQVWWLVRIRAETIFQYNYWYIAIFTVMIWYQYSHDNYGINTVHSVIDIHAMVKVHVSLFTEKILPKAQKCLCVASLYENFSSYKFCMQFLRFPSVSLLIIVYWPPIPRLHFLVIYPLKMLIYMHCRSVYRYGETWYHPSSTPHPPAPYCPLDILVLQKHAGSSNSFFLFCCPLSEPHPQRPVTCTYRHPVSIFSWIHVHDHCQFTVLWRVDT